MNPNEPLISLRALEGAIDYHPLIVSPDTLVVEAIALMSQARGNCETDSDSKKFGSNPNR